MHEIKTVAGGKLLAYMRDGNLLLKDAKGRTAKVTIANVMQSNGVIHVIDTVLLPNRSTQPKLADQRARLASAVLAGKHFANPRRSSWRISS